MRELVINSDVMQYGADVPNVKLTPRLVTHRDVAWVEVDLPSVLHNAHAMLSAIAGKQILAVVKANGYGLGGQVIANFLDSEAGVWGFAVATLDEGIELREAGISKPLLVLRPTQSEALSPYRHHELRPVLEDIGDNVEVGTPFHVEVDTGMGRTGVRWDDSSVLQRLASAKPEGAFTHFHSADSCSESILIQRRRFRQALLCMRQRPCLLHAANSVAAWNTSEQFDLVRPGIFLYGGSPGPGLPLPEPVVSLRAKVISVRTLTKGDSVSYGATWRADSDARIATLPLGYADGIPRVLSADAHVLVNGHKCPIVGRVTMDMTMVDVDPARVGSVQIGDTATLIGASNGSSITLEQFAIWAKTISYDVLTSLGSRLPRLYLSD